MAKLQPVVKTKTAEQDNPADQGPPTWARTGRETVESIVVAFVLAFLFRTFEAEAFVIPTGSMAPTLQGRHKDLHCAKCNYLFQAGASEEVDKLDGHELGPMYQVVSCVCPQCRYVNNVDPELGEGGSHESFNGDRILVGKFPYEFGDPERWDVVVFKFPGDAKMNYIKRLVGLPGETIRIFHGDIYTRKDEPDFEIARKPPAKLRAMAQMVYDNDFVARELIDKGWPERWQPLDPVQAGQPGGWKLTEDRSLETDGAAKESWARYRHIVPSSSDWQLAEKGGAKIDFKAEPDLIVDFYPYNTSLPRSDRNRQTRHPALDWIGDLMLDCEMDVQGGAGQALLDLVEGGKHFRCTLDAATGEAKLSIDGVKDYHPTASTAFRGPGKHQVAFSNFDDELLLWVDGKVAGFDSPTTFGPLGNDIPNSDAADGDLAPAGIGSRGLALRVSHVRLLRDIYYIADRFSNRHDGTITDFDGPGGMPTHPGDDRVFSERRSEDFPLAVDQFFVLGDNSPCSADSRLWTPDEQFVRRELLIGKALFIYWPHPWPTAYSIPLRFRGYEFRIPFIPNFSRMKLVR